MGRLQAWWSSLSPAQRTLISVGIPGVAIAAIVASRRPAAQPKESAADQAQGAGTSGGVAYTGPPVFADTSAGFDLYRGLVEQFNEQLELIQNQISNLPSAGGNQGVPKGYVPVEELIEDCKSTGGAVGTLAQMRFQGVSYNDPRLAGTPCLNKYVLFGLSQGDKPA